MNPQYRKNIRTLTKINTFRLCIGFLFILVWFLSPLFYDVDKAGEASVKNWVCSFFSGLSPFCRLCLKLISLLFSAIDFHSHQTTFFISGCILSLYRSFYCTCSIYSSVSLITEAAEGPTELNKLKRFVHLPQWQLVSCSVWQRYR